MARMSNEIPPAAVIGVVLSAVAIVGLLLYGRNAAAAAKRDPPPGTLPLPKLEPLGFLPGLKVGDTVVIDTAEANTGPPSNALPFLVCQVDMLLIDPTLVSVAAVAGTFKGTIPRSAIKKVLSVDPGNLQS